MVRASATVTRLKESATVTVEVRPLVERSFVVLELDSSPRVETAFTTTSDSFASAYGASACEGVRYATRLAGRDRTVVVLSITGSNLSMDVNDAIAHAAMYAAWDALGFDYTSVDILVDKDWVLQTC